MKALLVSCVLITVACKQGDKPAGTHAGSGSGSGSGSSVISAGSGSGSGQCIITVAIRPGTITYDGGGIAGNVDRKPGEAPNLDVLKPFAGKCATLVTADPSLLYQDVIVVMDTLVKDGIVDISLGKPGDKPTTERPIHPDLGSNAVKTEWKTGPDGRLVLEGTLDKSVSSTELVKNALVLIVSKTQVLLQNKEIAKPDDAALEDEISAALPANPKDP